MNSWDSVIREKDMQETKYWTWHMLAGAVILVLLGIHIITVHMWSLLGWFNPAGGKATEWANLTARARLGIYAVTYIVLLAAAFYHGLYGFRTILFELGLKPGSQRLLNILFIIMGTCFFTLGAWVTLRFHWLVRAT